MIKTPRFWTSKTLSSRAISLSLLPFTLIYKILYFLTNLIRVKTKISKPVICVGNVTAGGSGKTPAVIALSKIFKNEKINFAILSRGYKGNESKFLKLTKNLDPKKYGDEAILLAEHGLTFISKNRTFGAKEIAKISNIEVILTDDGMQNNSLYKDFIILVIDGKIGFGNGFLLPAGPLRESVSSAVKKANLVIIINEDCQNIISKIKNIDENKKIILSKIEPENLEQFKGQKLLAFCGLAYPVKFFKYLRDLNLNLASEVSFPDHHNYSQKDLNNLLKISQKQKAKLITTKKDWIKFPKKYQEKINYLDIDLKFNNEKLILDEIGKILKNESQKN